MDHTVDVTIHATAATVWAILRDVERWPEWTPSMTRVERLESGPLALGSRTRIKQPGLAPLVWTVTALTEGQSFTWRAASPGLTLEAVHALAPGADDGVTVHLAVAIGGALGRLLGTITATRARGNLDHEAQGLKARAESTRDGAHESGSSRPE